MCLYIYIPSLALEVPPVAQRTAEEPELVPLLPTLPVTSVSTKTPATLLGPANVQVVSLWTAAVPRLFLGKRHYKANGFL